jgi:ribose 5-phosphate isomerase B
MSSTPVRIAIGSDHAGLHLRAEVAKVLRERGLEVNDLGPHGPESVDYPDFAAKVCAEIASGRATLGVLVCGTGIGMSIAANKIHGIRAALCHTEFEARMARAHNDANVLCLGERVTGAGVAASVLAAFVDGFFEGGRHAKRLEKINALDAAR